MYRLLSVAMAIAVLDGASIIYAQTSPGGSSTTSPSVTMPSSPSGGSSMSGPSSSMSGPLASESEVRQKLQAEGYTSIGDIKKSGDKYRAKAIKDGKEVTLDIDAQSGTVSSQ